jgi:hypothetical protein
MVWKNKDAERLNYKKKITFLEEYISRCEARQQKFYDKSELGRIAKRASTTRDAVRAVLRRRGYRLSANANGIFVWIKKA